MDNLFADNEKQLEFWILLFSFLRYCLLRVRSVHLHIYTHMQPLSTVVATNANAFVPK